jgi:hypothetical protein
MGVANPAAGGRFSLLTGACAHGNGPGLSRGLRGDAHPFGVDAIDRNLKDDDLSG